MKRKKKTVFLRLLNECYLSVFNICAVVEKHFDFCKQTKKKLFDVCFCKILAIKLGFYYQHYFLFARSC